MLTTGQIIALIVLILFLMTAAASAPTYYAITRKNELSELTTTCGTAKTDLQTHINICDDSLKTCVNNLANVNTSLVNVNTSLANVNTKLDTVNTNLSNYNTYNLENATNVEKLIIERNELLTYKTTLETQKTELVTEINELETELNKCQNNPNKLIGMYSTSIGKYTFYINITDLVKKEDPIYQYFLTNYPNSKISSYLTTNKPENKVTSFLHMIRKDPDGYRTHLIRVMQKNSNNEYVSINDSSIKDHDNICKIKLENDGNVYFINIDGLNEQRLLLTPIDIYNFINQ